MGPNRPGLKGFCDLPTGIDGLYLGGPGITFTPGNNAPYQVSTTSADVPLRGRQPRATPLRSKRCSRSSLPLHIPR
jgi:hypothetical protein